MVRRVGTTETTEVIHKCSNAISEETTQHARRRSCELTAPPSELTIHPCQSEEFLLDITCRKQRLENNIVNLRIPMAINSIWCGQDSNVARSLNTTHSNVQVAMCEGVQRQIKARPVQRLALGAVYRHPERQHFRELHPLTGNPSLGDGSKHYPRQPMNSSLFIKSFNLKNMRLDVEGWGKWAGYVERFEQGEEVANMSGTGSIWKIGWR